MRTRPLTLALVPLLLAVMLADEAFGQRADAARAASPASAASTGRARPGAVVRVLRPDGAIFRGLLRSVDSAAVVLDPPHRGGAVRRVELAEVDALEVRSPTSAARVLAFAAGGAGTMALLFAAINAADDPGTSSGFDTIPLLSGGGEVSIPVVALVGGALGVVLGVRTAPERWERVPLPGR